MRINSLPMLLLCAALSLQCSDDNGSATDEFSGNPPPKGNGNSFSPITISGYADETNARLFVNSVDSVVVAPEYAWVAEMILGDKVIFPYGNYTDVFFDYDSGYAFQVSGPPAVDSYNLLCVSRGDNLYLPQWDLTYAYDADGWLYINGRGVGSHIMDLYNDHYEAFKASEVVFYFRGRGPLPDSFIDYDFDYKGEFSIIERSPEASYNLAIYGTLEIELEWW